MFVKSTTILALLSVAAQVIATPPACLIAALSSQSDPSDISTICNNPSAVQSYITSKCGDNQQLAMTDFASVCSNAGVTISTTSPSSSASSSASGTTSVSPSSSSTTAASNSITSVSGTSSADLSSSTGTASSGSQSTGSPSTMTTSVISATGTTGSTVTTGTASSTTTTPNSGVTPSSKANAGNAVRLGMDCLGLAALGMFGAMLAL